MSKRIPESWLGVAVQLGKWLGARLVGRLGWGIAGWLIAAWAAARTGLALDTRDWVASSLSTMPQQLVSVGATCSLRFLRCSGSQDFQVRFLFGQGWSLQMNQRWRFLFQYKAECRSTYRWPGSEPAGLREIGPLIGICMSQPELWPEPVGQVLTKSRLTHELTQILKNDL